MVVTNRSIAGADISGSAEVQADFLSPTSGDTSITISEEQDSQIKKVLRSCRATADQAGFDRSDKKTEDFAYSVLAMLLNLNSNNIELSSSPRGGIIIEFEYKHFDIVIELANGQIGSLTKINSEHDEPPIITTLRLFELEDVVQFLLV